MQLREQTHRFPGEAIPSQIKVLQLVEIIDPRRQRAAEQVVGHVEMLERLERSDLGEGSGEVVVGNGQVLKLSETDNGGETEVSEET